MNKHTCVYIYIYRERERYGYTHIHIYTYTHIVIRTPATGSMTDRLSRALFV